LVVGTIHQRHHVNENYTYQNILDILDCYKPDAICVEIREEEFRQELYLKEMVLSAIYGLDNSIRVYPIDWWTGNARSERGEYMKTQEYENKNSELDLLRKNDSVIQSFESKYGSWAQYSKNQGYSFFNGPEYNEYIQTGYDLSMKVFGDHSMNLYYETRNNNMWENILAVIENNPGKKIIVFTGCEHKHYFDNKLLGLSSDVKHVDFEAILPLSSVGMDEELEYFYAKKMITSYLDKSKIEDIDIWYKNSLMPYIHGPDMDFYPEIIPETNIKIAEIILDEWIKDKPNSILMRFELCWTHFLKGSYHAAITEYENILSHLKEVKPEELSKNMEISIYRNMGLSYDLLGERQSAINCYEKGKSLFLLTNRNENVLKGLFKDYIDSPYSKNRGG
jgi:tetratricopeptide (TPR) repeat protein